MKKINSPWSLSQYDIGSITNKEYLYGTSRLLPPVADIPKEFWDGNVYTRLVEAMYVGEKPAHAEVIFLPGFVNDGTSLSRMTMSHLRDMNQDYDYRIAGVAYMISKVVKITAILT